MKHTRALLFAVAAALLLGEAAAVRKGAELRERCSRLGNSYANEICNAYTVGDSSQRASLARLWQRQDAASCEQSAISRAPFRLEHAQSPWPLRFSHSPPLKTWHLSITIHTAPHSPNNKQTSARASASAASSSTLCAARAAPPRAARCPPARPAGSAARATRAAAASGLRRSRRARWRRAAAAPAARRPRQAARSSRRQRRRRGRRRRPSVACVLRRHWSARRFKTTIISFPS